MLSNSGGYMNYAALTAEELVERAKANPKFNMDALFTALVARLEYVMRPTETPAAHYNQTEVASVRPEPNA